MHGSAETHAKLTWESITRYSWLLWVIWLTFLDYPLAALFHSHPPPLRVAVVLAAVALFCAVYIRHVWYYVRRLLTGEPRSSPWLAPAILALLAVALSIGDRRDWLELFIYVGVSTSPSLPTGKALRAIVSMAALALVLALLTGAGPGAGAALALQIMTSGFATVLVVRIIEMERQLRLAREEIARLAVSEERLRFARDLHDLLGHSLSLIALKSDLVGRLLPAHPEQAAAENRDVGEVARTALQEVREAVAGYRQTSLAEELQGAGEILAAAGIELRREGEPGSLPPPVEAALAWVVREGVTNVIKHSRARRCTISLRRDDGDVALQITDNGRGGPGAGSGRAGSGLAGMAERVRSLGGRCECQALADGGFRIAASIPVPRDEERLEPRDAGIEAVV